MTRKQERYAALCFLMVLAFMTYRTIEKKAWNDEERYRDGVERTNMVYIHHQLGGTFR